MLRAKSDVYDFLHSCFTEQSVFSSSIEHASPSISASTHNPIGAFWGNFRHTQREKCLVALAGLPTSLAV